MTKLPIKREKFCMHLVEHGSRPDAYRFAYNVQPGTKATSIRAECSKIMADPLVKQRIAELKDKIRKRHDLKIDDIMAELDENRDLALREKQASAATQATMGKAKVAGFLIDKMQVDVTLRGLKERMRQRKSKGTT